MEKKNDGFTIVELVIIIAIMGILVAAFSLNIGSITGYDAKECYKKVSSAITANKIEALGKAKSTGDIYLEIYKDTSNNRYYARTITEAKSGSPVTGASTKLNKWGRIKVSYETESGAVTQVDGSQSLFICFNRASGAIVDKDSPHDVTNIKYIHVESNTGSYKYTIELVPKTGKVIS